MSSKRKCSTAAKKQILFFFKSIRSPFFFLRLDSERESEGGSHRPRDGV